MMHSLNDNKLTKAGTPRQRAPKGSVKGLHPCPTCEKIYENKTGKKKYCSANCQPRISTTCMTCSSIFQARKKSEKYCCIKCRNDDYGKISLTHNLSDHSKDDLITCKICGFRCNSLQVHLNHKHLMTLAEYKSKYNLKTEDVIHASTLKKLSEGVSGKKNVWFNHGGKLSPFSKNNIRISEQQRLQNQKNIILNRELNGNGNTSLEFYLKKTNNIEEAKKMLSNRQTTFSLEICIKKYGKEDGLKRWQRRQQKWHSNYKKSNYSRISQDLFLALRENLSSNLDIYFAECNGADRNDEFIFSTKCGSVFKLDFYVPALYKIIEFDGTYWHNRNKVSIFSNKSRDEIRDSQILETDSRLKIMHVKEHDYRLDRQGTIQKCLEFLKSY